jgi:hypothetical protein
LSEPGAVATGFRVRDGEKNPVSTIPGSDKTKMMAYLVMMAVRLKELHRVLNPTGSLYLHCDPTASHYLKMYI